MLCTQKNHKIIMRLHTIGCVCVCFSEQTTQVTILSLSMNNTAGRTAGSGGDVCYTRRVLLWGVNGIWGLMKKNAYVINYYRYDTYTCIKMYECVYLVSTRAFGCRTR